MCDYAAASRGKQAASSQSPLAISQPNHQEPRTEKQSSTQLPEWSPLSINTTKQWTSAIVRLCSSKQGQQQHGQSCSDRSKQRHKQERSATEPIDRPAATRPILQRQKQAATSRTSSNTVSLAATQAISDTSRNDQRQSPSTSSNTANLAATEASSNTSRSDQRQSPSAISDRAHRPMQKQAATSRNDQRQSPSTSSNTANLAATQAISDTSRNDQRQSPSTSSNTANLASNLAATEHIEQRQSPASSGANGEASSANAYKYSEDLKRCGCLLADQIS